MMHQSIQNHKGKDEKEPLLSSHDNKLFSILFFLLILALPTQLGKHSWPFFSFVLGQRVDYLSPTLYISDILSILCIGIWFSSFVRRGVRIPLSYLLRTSLLFLFLSVGIFFSRNPFAGWYGLLKLGEYMLLGSMLIDTLRFPFYQRLLLWGLMLGVIFESGLALFQYIGQGSLGGVLYFLGERTFTATTPGIANASLNGQLVLRPYGTFSHPNVLAGYLLIASTIILTAKQVQARYKGILVVISSLGILLTLSRTVLILWGLYLVYQLFGYLKKTTVTTRLLLILSALSLSLLLYMVVPFIHGRFALSLTDETITYRLELLHASWQMFLASPLFGVGFANYLPNLPFYAQFSSPVFVLQPVHNIFALILSETGILGLGLVVWGIYQTLRHRLYVPFLILLVLGIGDHYLLTLQQGQLLVVLVIALCWSKGERGSIIEG